MWLEKYSSDPKYTYDCNATDPSHKTTKPPAASNKRFSWWAKGNNSHQGNPEVKQQLSPEASDKEVGTAASNSSNIRCIPVQLEDMAKVVSFFVNVVLTQAGLQFFCAYHQFAKL